MKKIAFAAIAATSIALTACSSSDSETESAPETVTVTESAKDSGSSESDSKETESKETESKKSEKQDSGKNNSHFDEAALIAAAEKAGYTCDRDDCFKEENDVRTELGFDHDSADVQVEALKDGADIEAAYTAGLEDLGTALEGQDLGEAKWDEIKKWATDSAQERETRGTFDVWDVKLENDTERGMAERSFELEHMHS